MNRAACRGVKSFVVTLGKDIPMYALAPTPTPADAAPASVRTAAEMAILQPLRFGLGGHRRIAGMQLGLLQDDEVGRGPLRILVRGRPGVGGHSVDCPQPKLRMAPIGRTQ